jgi:hypothetical protein
VLAPIAGGRNVVINGAMQVAQRGTSTASITTTGYYTADRWNTTLTALGTWTQSVEADAPTGSGFRNSLKMLCTTANVSPAVDAILVVRQYLEGQNVQQFVKGTASAKQFALSFWVKSNVTGTYIADLRDASNSRSVSASYTISASATWEKKTIVFPADTTGAFGNDNTRTLDVNWWLGAGTNYTSGTLATTWSSVVNANRTVGQTNLAAATNNYWQITGVQLEVGAVATPFEFENYGITLLKCHRYFQHIVDSQFGGFRTTTQTQWAQNYLRTMRTAPTFTLNGLLAHDLVDGDNLTLSALGVVAAGSNSAWLLATNTGTGVAGNACVVYPTGSPGGLYLSAEL